MHFKNTPVFIGNFRRLQVDFESYRSLPVDLVPPLEFSVYFEHVCDTCGTSSARSGYFLCVPLSYSAHAWDAVAAFCVVRLSVSFFFLMRPLFKVRLCTVGKLPFPLTKQLRGSSNIVETETDT